MARKPTIQTEDKYVIRFPEGMRDQLKAAAEKNNRSMNAEIVARIETYDALQWRMGELVEERERLSAELKLTKDDLGKQRIVSQQLQHLINEDSRTAQRDQETLSEIERRYNELREQAQYLEKLKADLLEISKERDELAQEHIREQAAVIEKLSQSQKTNRLILNGLKKVFLNSSDKGDDLKKLVEIFETIGDEDV